MQVSSLLAIVVVGALCFALGASLAPLTVAVAQAQFVGAAERVSLTVLEQSAIQALHVEVDRQKLKALRVEAESYAPGWVKSFERRRRSCSDVRRQRTGSRRLRTWTRA